MSQETDALLGQLDAQRQHVLGILEGLSEDQLRRPVLPSGWHCLGLVKHLALADERYWFRCVVADELPEPADDWEVGPGQSAEDIFALYREEIRQADAVIAATPLDAPPRRSDAVMDFPDLRSVVLHVITETAVHAGHLDAVRELIDGRQWVVLDARPAVPDRIRLSSVAVNCPNAAELAGFYATITGGRVTFADDTWATVAGPYGRIDFQTVADYTPPTWPGPLRMHLDFSVDDLDAAAVRVVAAGATRFDVQPNADHCLVFADPVGHPFCLTTWDEIPAPATE